MGKNKIKHYDLLVIGGGAAGMVGAAFLHPFKVK